MNITVELRSLSSDLCFLTRILRCKSVPSFSLPDVCEEVLSLLHELKQTYHISSFLQSVPLSLLEQKKSGDWSLKLKSKAVYVEPKEKRSFQTTVKVKKKKKKIQHTFSTFTIF